ncbi:MAG TPA: c-type cytochrome, partial [Planctomycetota bacterium]|nr:c-type cytochrome [Planctomycetota bacterium]
MIDPAPGPLEKLVKAGAGVYKQQCLVCHGAEGKGDGPAAQVLGTPPRNFTRGQYKFKTSVPDEMPFDEDLYRTISAGISAAGMPSFGDLTPFERWAMVAYVKSLSGFVDTDDGARYNYFELYPAKTKMSLPAPPDKGAIDFARGAHLYREKVQCLKCHGDNGVGDGPSAASLVDADGRTIKPADLTRGEITFKAGDRVEDIYRVLLT